jgi:hypothetical protein
MAAAELLAMKAELKLLRCAGNRKRERKRAMRGGLRGRGSSTGKAGRLWRGRLRVSATADGVKFECFLGGKANAKGGLKMREKEG